MNTPLKDQVVLVSGAAGGLGEATAKALAAAGATVVLLGKTIARLERVYDDIMAAGHPEPAIYPMNLMGATEADYLRLAEVLHQELGSLNGLIHTAAELDHLAPLEQISAETWERSLRVNLTAPFLLTRSLLPLLTGCQATVVFTTDSSARTGLAYWGAYGISKTAVERLAHLLSHEHEGKLRVHVFEPGVMASPLRRRAFPGEAIDLLSSPGEAAARLVALFRQE
ncbi:SDR family NAD(P)-dependent oxidoreductase [Candidatus Woesearchaeota archaeon]|nr:SDR family NAD(P)-dependent oxidoreductase [Candidatus Woesearchaeota archaeon]